MILKVYIPITVPILHYKRKGDQENFAKAFAVSTEVQRGALLFDSKT
jgi:hypothetical protein